MGPVPDPSERTPLAATVKLPLPVMVPPLHGFDRPVSWSGELPVMVPPVKKRPLMTAVPVVLSVVVPPVMAAPPAGAHVPLSVMLLLIWVPPAAPAPIDEVFVSVRVPPEKARTVPTPEL